MRVRFLGGRKVKGLVRADGTRLAVGEEADLPPRVVAIFRQKGYHFEALDGEELPDPVQVVPPVEDSEEERRRQYEEHVAEMDARAAAEAAAAAQVPDGTQEPDEP